MLYPLGLLSDLSLFVLLFVRCSRITTISLRTIPSPCWNTSFCWVRCPQVTREREENSGLLRFYSFFYRSDNSKQLYDLVQYLAQRLYLALLWFVLWLREARLWVLLGCITLLVQERLVRMYSCWYSDETLFDHYKSLAFL